MYLLHLLVPGVHMGGGGVVATLPCPYIPGRIDLEDASVPSSLVESVSQDSPWQVEFASEYASRAEFSDYSPVAVASEPTYAAVVGVAEYVPASVGVDVARNSSIGIVNDVHSIIERGQVTAAMVDAGETVAISVSAASEYVPSRNAGCCCD